MKVSRTALILNVCDIAKILIFKRITTQTAYGEHSEQMSVILQRY